MSTRERNTTRIAPNTCGWLLRLGAVMDQGTVTYDAFISHSHIDAKVVADLAHNLADAFNFNLWLDCWVLVPGGLWQQAIAKALHQARSCIVCLGSHTPRGWFEQEIQRARNRQVAEPK